MLLFLTSFIFIMSSCTKKEDAAIPKTGVEIISVGSIKFGNVILGEYRESVIRFTNYGPEIVTGFTPSTQLSVPFSVSSLSAACSSSTIPVNATCELKIKFTPVVNGTWTQIITIGNKSQETSGRGMDSAGIVNFSTNLFSLGTVVAGETSFQDLVLTNQGNFTIITPMPINLPIGVVLANNDCGAYMASNKVCSMRFSIYKSAVGTAVETFMMRSRDIADYPINVLATTKPGPPAGTVAFLSPPESIIADGTDTKLLITAPIRDQFNNIVADGESVTIIPYNLTMSGPMTLTTIGGQVSFTVKATTQRGDSTVTLIGGASGFIRIKALAGPPVGLITADNFINTVTANGITIIDMRINSLTDQFGNIVEDNTPVIFELTGGGTLSANSISTVLGKVQQLITAPTTVGTSTLVVKSGSPTSSSVCGYSACGNFTLNFVPGDASGTIAVTPVHAGIFADPSLGISLGELTQTVVNFGPVRDQYNNIVATGTTLNLSLENGVNVFNSTLTTNSSGMASFTVAGTGVRGPIKIGVSKLTASGSGEVWAYNATTLRADSPGLPTSAYNLYLSYFSDTALPSLNNVWGKISNWGNIDIQDNNFYGDKKKSAPPTLIVRSSVSEVGIHPSTKLPYFEQNCLFSSGINTYAGACFLNTFDGQNSSAYQYQFRKTLADDGNSAMIIENTNANTLSSHRESPSGCYKVDQQPSSTTQNYLMFMNSVEQVQCGVYDQNVNPLSEGFWNSNPIAGCYIQDTNVTSPMFGLLKIISPNMAGCGFISLQDPAGLYFNIGQLPLVHYPLKQSTRGYISDLDKLLVFGGYYINPKLDFFGSSILATLSNRSTFVLNKGSGTVFNQLETDNVNDSLGDYPLPSAFAQTATSNRNLYMFGGLNIINSSIGTNVNYSLTRPTDRFYMYSGNTSKWTMLSPNSDNTISDPNQASSPYSRYQHGIVYVPDNNSLYLGSGKAFITTQAIPQGSWLNPNDLWSVNLTDMSNLSWKRECFPCGFPANAHNQAANIVTEQDINPTDLRMTWHPYIQRVMMLWSGTSNAMQFFNPLQSGTKTILSENYSFNSGGTNIIDSNMRQIEFNQNLGRTYFYKRTARGSSTSNAYYWDMDIANKQYYKVEIDLGGSGAKTFIRDLQVRMRGYGKITNLSGGILSSGLTSKIFNYTTNSWESLATTAAAQSFDSNNYLNKDFLASVSKNYVSADGKINILVYPTGSSSSASFNEVFIDEVYISGTF